MTNPTIRYFEQEDILHLLISEGTEVYSVELGPHITAELNANGELIGIEILNAATFLRDSLMESIQLKLLQAPPLQPA